MTPADIDALLSGAAGCSIAVVGDLMVDIYTIGAVDRISPEAPVPVVAITERRSSPGGAANAAVCLAALGPRTTLIGTVGSDSEGAELQLMLDDLDVTSRLTVTADEPTITKHRVWSANQQLLRLDTERRPEPGVARQRLTDTFRADDYDAVLISDYGKGVLDADSTPWLIAQCRAAGVPVVVDPKSADFTMYRGATILKPNEKEAQLAYLTRHGRQGTIEEIGAYLAAEVADYAAVTRGPNGIDLFSAGTHVHVPVHRQNVYDVTGAGDVAAAALTVCAALERPIERSCALANAAARISVSRVGTGSVTIEDLHMETMTDE